MMRDNARRDLEKEPVKGAKGALVVVSARA